MNLAEKINDAKVVFSRHQESEKTLNESKVLIEDLEEGSVVKVERGEPGSGNIEDGWKVFDVNREDETVLVRKDMGGKSFKEKTIPLAKILKLNPRFK